MVMNFAHRNDSQRVDERSNTGYGERRGAAHAGARGGFAVSGQMKTSGWLEEVNQLGDQFQTLSRTRSSMAASSVSKAILRSRDSSTIRPSSRVLIWQ